MTFSTVEEIDISKLSHREWEVFERVVGFDAWQECKHGKQIVTVMAHWSDEAPFTVTTGRQNSTQRFTRTIHADGTPSNIERYGDCYGIHTKCSRCGAIDSLSTEQQAYGDLISCSQCDYSQYCSIGD